MRERRTRPATRVCTLKLRPSSLIATRVRGPVRLGLVFALLMASFAFLPATPVLAHADLPKAEFEGDVDYWRATKNAGHALQRGL